MIFGRRWYGIKGETIEPGNKYELSVVRVQTTKDGPWQALTDKELEQLLVEHNQVIALREQIANDPRQKAKEQKAAQESNLKGPYTADPIGKIVRDSIRKKKVKSPAPAKKIAKKKGKKK